MKKNSPLYLFIKSAVAIVLTSAAIHLTVTAIYSIAHQNLDVANVFRVIGVDLIFPSLGTGVVSFWWSIAYCFIGAGIWYAIFYFASKRRTNQDQ